MEFRVVDTDVWSYLFKGRDEAKLYEPHLLDHIIVISFQTQAELVRWALSANWGDRRRGHLEAQMRRCVVEHSSDALSWRWAEAIESARRNGRPIFSSRCLDCGNRTLLGAPLVTHNKSHFIGVDGLTIISESAGQRT